MSKAIVSGKPKSTQPVIHRHILIIPSPVEGELWFDRYQELPPLKDEYLSVDQVEVARTSHTGVYQVYRMPGVSAGTFLLAVRTLQGYISYERSPRYQRLESHSTKRALAARGNHGD